MNALATLSWSLFLSCLVLLPGEFAPSSTAKETCGLQRGCERGIFSATIALPAAEEESTTHYGPYLYSAGPAGAIDSLTHVSLLTEGPRIALPASLQSCHTRLQI